MAISYVNSTSDDGAFGSISNLGGFGFTVQAGDTVLICAGFPSTTDSVSSVTTNGGGATTGSWSLLGSQVGVDATAGSLYLYKAVVVAGGDLSVDVEGSGGMTAIAVAIRGVGSIDSGGGPRKNSQSAGNTHTPTVGSFSTTVADAMLVTFMCTNDTPGTITAGTGLTEATQITSGQIEMASDYLIRSATISTSFVAATTSNTINHYSVIGVFYDIAVTPSAAPILIGVLY